MAARSRPTTLARALPGAEFVEHHDRIVEADVGAVWGALEATCWSDLTVTKPLVAIRLLGRVGGGRGPRLMDGRGPVRLLRRESPRYVVGGRIGRPWQLNPVQGPDVNTLAELRTFAEPGWLKYGMDFQLTALGDRRTRLETTTRCEPTDAHARRAFARYWRLIRPFSGLIRRDLLHSVAARAEAIARAERKAAIA